MKYFLRQLIFIFIFSISPQISWGSLIVSEDELLTLANELAPKVDSYQAIWKSDPQALIFGGSSRDFLYWIKKQFQGVESQDQAASIMRQLRQMTVIETRDFMMQDSDIDVVSFRHDFTDGKAFGITGINSIHPDRIDAKTSFGHSEVIQGYIPAEKIAIGRRGVVHLPQFGNGAAEIFSGRLSIHYGNPEEFAQTYYAIQKLNHPVLLALRFIRLLAMDYYYNYGKGFPKISPLQNVSADDVKATKEVIQNAWQKAELNEHLRIPKFVEWLNGTINKAFRSYANPTAAKMLMEHFGVGKLGEAYPQIKVLNFFLYAKNYKQDLIAANLKKFNVSTDEFYLNVQKDLSDGYLYHGTESEVAFRSILGQGNIPSEGGTAGEGVYAVSKKDVAFAINWSGRRVFSLGGGGEDLVVKLHIKKTAKIVDVTRGEGMRVWNEWCQSKKAFDYEAFAENFGVDIISYPYSPRAYVIKNSDAIDATEGYTRQVMSLARAVVAVRDIDSVERLLSFYKSAVVSKFTPQEIQLIGNNLIFQPSLHETLKAVKGRKLDQTEAYILMKALKEVSSVRPFVQAKLNENPENREILQALIFDFFDGRSTDQLALILEHLKPEDKSLFRDQIRVAAKTLSFNSEATGIWQGAIGALPEGYLEDVASAFFAAGIDVTSMSLNNLKNFKRFLNPTESIFTRGYWSLVLFEHGERSKSTFDNIVQFGANLDLKNQKRDATLNIEDMKYSGKEKFRILDLLQQATLQNPFLKILKTQEELQGYVKAIQNSRLLYLDTSVCLERVNQINFEPLMSVPKKDVAYVINELSNLFSHLRHEAQGVEERKLKLDILRTKIGQILKKSPLVTSIEIENVFRDGLATTSFFYGAEISKEVEDEMLVLVREGRGFQRWAAILFILNNHTERQIGLRNLAIQALPDILKTARFDQENAYLGNRLKTQGFDRYQFLSWMRFTLQTLVNAENVSEKDIQNLIYVSFEGWDYLEPKIIREFEDLRMQLLLKHLKGNHGFETLSTLYLSSEQSEWTRLAAARVLRTSYRDRDFKNLEMKLKGANRKQGIFNFFAKKESVHEILSQNNGLRLRLLVELGSHDSDLSDYLVNSILNPVADSKLGGVVAPLTAIQYLSRLDIRDSRVLPKIQKELDFVSTKNFDIYFTALVKLFPERGDIVYRALYNFRNTPSVVVGFLKILREEVNSDLMKTLRTYRQNNSLTLVATQKIQGLYLDEWLEKQVPSKRFKAVGLTCEGLFNEI